MLSPPFLDASLASVNVEAHSAHGGGPGRRSLCPLTDPQPLRAGSPNSVGSLGALFNWPTEGMVSGSIPRHGWLLLRSCSQIPSGQGREGGVPEAIRISVPCSLPRGILGNLSRWHGTKLKHVQGYLYSAAFVRLAIWMQRTMKERRRRRRAELSPAWSVSLAVAASSLSFAPGCGRRATSTFSVTREFSRVVSPVCLQCQCVNLKALLQYFVTNRPHPLQRGSEDARRLGASEIGVTAEAQSLVGGQRSAERCQPLSPIVACFRCTA